MKAWLLVDVVLCLQLMLGLLFNTEKKHRSIVVMASASFSEEVAHKNQKAHGHMQGRWCMVMEDLRLQAQ